MVIGRNDLQPYELDWREFVLSHYGLTKKRKEVTRSVMKCQEASKDYVFVILMFCSNILLK